MSLGRRMRELRTERKRGDGKPLLQKDVADALHVARSTVGMWENDERKPTPEMLRAIASSYDATLDYLLAEEQVAGILRSYEETDNELYKRNQGGVASGSNCQSPYCTA